jgi:hypothetical protein
VPTGRWRGGRGGLREHAPAPPAYYRPPAPAPDAPLPSGGHPPDAASAIRLEHLRLGTSPLRGLPGRPHGPFFHSDTSGLEHLRLVLLGGDSHFAREAPLWFCQSVSFFSIYPPLCLWGRGPTPLGTGVRAPRRPASCLLLSGFWQSELPGGFCVLFDRQKPRLAY